LYNSLKMTLQKNLQFFIKELSKNKSKITKVFFTIFISLLIFSSVTILKNSIENQINNNSKVFLGGDLELSTKNKALDLNFLNELKESFLVAKVFEFTSIIRTLGEESKTTRIKVIDEFYPLIGNVIVEPTDSLKLLKMKPNTILIDKTIQKNLDLKLGNRVKIQNISFEVIGIIESLPDIGGFFLFGDQALISESSYKSLKVNNLGSFISFKYKLLKKNNNQKIPKNLSEYENLEIKYPEDVSQNLKKVIENFIYFLSIISASAILISGIGLKNSLFSFLTNNQFKIAIYKSLGLSSQNIKLLYYTQTLLILILCSFFSYIFSLLIISFLDHSLFNFLNIQLEVKFKIYEYLIIQFFSILVFFIFAKPVLNSIDQIKVADLFRNSSTNLNLNYNRKSVLEISTFLLIFIFSFCIINVKPLQTAIFFLFFIIISFFYFCLSKLYILILNKIKNIHSISLKMIIKDLKTYHSLNSIIIMTMGLGITILFFLGFVSSNINKELNTSIPKNAPHYFFLGIQQNELNLFSEQISKIDNDANQIVVPMISARIEAINNRKPKEIIDETNRSYWFINGERRISWLKNPPANNPIVEGEWWYSDEKNNLKLSLDHRVANDLKLKIGDSITFNIFGNSVSGIITNFRKVDYKDLNINFAILFNPRYSTKIPHEFLSTVKFKNDELVNLNNLLKRLPAITYIKLSDYIKKTKDFLNKLLIVSILISAVVISIGLIVISNAVSVIGNLKVYQNLVLRILGFEKSSLFRLIIFESLILFIPIIISSLAFSISFSYFFIVNFFSISWYFSFIIPIFISTLFLLVLLMTLLVSNRKYVNFNAYTLLRNG
tara:strand:- start:612 stop:3119 length:2508 start_codon:yes stop_codon:yes gene_type:complete